MTPTEIRCAALDAGRACFDADVCGGYDGGPRSSVASWEPEMGINGWATEHQAHLWAEDQGATLTDDQIDIWEAGWETGYLAARDEWCEEQEE